MKKIIGICVMLALSAVSGSTASASIIVNWDFYLETYGADDFWSSPTVIDITYPQYDYQWQVTQADLQINDSVWVSVLDEMPAGYKGGSGSEAGPPPCNILNPLHIADASVTADIYVSVDSSGYGQASISNINFGQLGWVEVTGARFGGDLRVNAVPEVGTLFLFGLGGLGLRRKHMA